MKSLGMEQGSLSSTLTAPLCDIQGQCRGVFDVIHVDRVSTDWKKLDVGWLKVNCDGAVCNNLTSSCGGVVHDAEDQWVKGFCRNLGSMSTTNVFLTELLDVATTVELVMSLDLAQSDYRIRFNGGDSIAQLSRSSLSSVRSHSVRYSSG